MGCGGVRGVGGVGCVRVWGCEGYGTHQQDCGYVLIHVSLCVQLCVWIASVHIAHVCVCMCVWVCPV